MPFRWRILLLQLACLVALHARVVSSADFSLDSSAGHAKWRGISGNGSIIFPASVPGSVHIDLLDNGILTEDVFYRYNEVEYSWVPFTEWIFETSFDLNDFKVRRVGVTFRSWELYERLAWGE